ncbi:uncharacterized protein [Cherax quadricarinatus]|uniref:uncharacterized protein n=1 Tax=Cherax quadricarinatus TaxID=27406 RepID=UPI00237835B9|nr:uncharacterized protein LOC128687581 [Cherax quadricarinatus]
MRVTYLILAWATWVCVGMMVSEGGGVAKTLPEAGERLRALQAKLSKLSGRPEMLMRESLPDHVTQVWSSWQVGGAGASTKRFLELKSPGDKMRAIRDRLVQRIMKEAKQLPSSSQSITSIAFLAFGVKLFDVLRDSMFGSTGMMKMGGDGDTAQARVAILPGLGLFGDNLNNLAEIVLNTITIYLYRDESPDCGERLLCESNQQAVSRGLLDSFVTYISGFAVSFLLHEAPLSRNLEAMRAGRKGYNCIELYPHCSITL